MKKPESANRFCKGGITVSISLEYARSDLPMIPGDGDDRREIAMAESSDS